MSTNQLDAHAQLALLTCRNANWTVECIVYYLSLVGELINEYVAIVDAILSKCCP